MFKWLFNGTEIQEGSHFIGTGTTNLVVNSLEPTDAGTYQLIASNAFGVATSPGLRINVHCVDRAGSLSLAPYTNWFTAATNIQDAIDIAGIGDFVLVTNGIYSGGGKVVTGSVTNRVAITKPVTVSSVNGAGVTVIEGAFDPSTNGPLAVRGAWLVDGATLAGFTLRNGATRTSGAQPNSYGGGVYCSSTNPVIIDCVISNNAAQNGGGCYVGTLARCFLLNNRAAQSGGGIYSSIADSCLLDGNSALSRGGGAASATLNNCTVIRNSAGLGGGISEIGKATNCIIYFNTATTSGSTSSANWLTSALITISSCCTIPLPTGAGNISIDPQFVDGMHLSVTSPCRNAGVAGYRPGTDLDGELWMNPPSMGCDEVYESANTGPLLVGLSAPWPEVAAWGTLPLTGQIGGRASRITWSFGDGSPAANASFLASHMWTNPGDYTVTFTAFNLDNLSGVSTNLLIHVVPLQAPSLSPAGLNAGTIFSLSFQGQAGVTYIVEQTTNLQSPVVWQPVVTLSSAGNLMQVTDSKATNSSRFYRVRSQ